MTARPQLPQHSRGDRLGARFAHPVNHQHGVRAEAKVVGHIFDETPPDFTDYVE